MQKQTFIRDKRSPPPKSYTVSRIMSSNKARDTNPEIIFRKELWRSGLKGYRNHSIRIIGRPDISFGKKKIAVFVNGCYWHRCPYCDLPLPKHNRAFWKKKFEANSKRDKRREEELKKEGWKVFVFWECKIKVSVKKSVEKVKKEYGRIRG